MVKIGSIILLCVLLGAMVDDSESLTLVELLSNPRSACFWLWKKRPVQTTTTAAPVTQPMTSAPVTAPPTTVSEEPTTVATEATTVADEATTVADDNP